MPAHSAACGRPATACLCLQAQRRRCEQVGGAARLAYHMPAEAVRPWPPGARAPRGRHRTHRTREEGGGRPGSTGPRGTARRCPPLRAPGVFGLGLCAGGRPDDEGGEHVEASSWPAWTGTQGIPHRVHGPPCGGLGGRQGPAAQGVRDGSGGLANPRNGHRREVALAGGCGTAVGAAPRRSSGCRTGPALPSSRGYATARRGEPSVPRPAGGAAAVAQLRCNRPPGAAGCKGPWARVAGWHGRGDGAGRVVSHPSAGECPCIATHFFWSRSATPICGFSGSSMPPLVSERRKARLGMQCTWCEPPARSRRAGNKSFNGTSECAGLPCTGAEP